MATDPKQVLERLQKELATAREDFKALDADAAIKRQMAWDADRAKDAGKAVEDALIAAVGALGKVAK